jgi:hypothetical protein
VLSREALLAAVVDGLDDAVMAAGPDAIVHHGMLDPGIAFLEKPITPDVLLAKVREVLDS